MCLCSPHAVTLCSMRTFIFLPVSMVGQQTGLKEACLFIPVTYAHTVDFTQVMFVYALVCVCVCLLYLLAVCLAGDRSEWWGRDEGVVGKRGVVQGGRKRQKKAPRVNLGKDGSE